MSVSHQIYEIINSEEFKKQLTKINSNYSNLKQEGIIRNAVLEQFNDLYANDSVRAFAEHPRINNTRVDLSIVNKGCLAKPYKIEFKYHFCDFEDSFASYHNRINHEFNVRNSNMYILIVQTFDSDKKETFDKSWDITTSFWKKKELNEKWKLNLNENFEKVIKISENGDSELLEIVSIDINVPYPTSYHFYILKRKKD